MRNKRLISTVTAIVFSSLVCGLAIFKMPSEGIYELLKGYFMLIGGLLGVYASSQTVTDSKKISHGGE